MRLLKQGRAFGPFSQFRIDLHEAEDTFVATAYDAGEPDARGNPSPCAFVRVKIAPETPAMGLAMLKQQALNECQTVLGQSQAWKDAQRLGEEV